MNTKMSKESKVTYQSEDEILKEICTCNGINYSHIEHEGQSCVKLEMFFSGMPQIVSMSKFPNLQSLCLMGQTIDTMEGLDGLYKLRELWIAECKVKKIEGLEQLKHLRKLYLYDNHITKMENLEHLHELESLWLNKNKITEIECVTGLKCLTELNLANNLVEKIGNSLNSLHHLERLELSGNQISSFKDLIQLQKLPHLKVLGLKSPEYSANPVGLLCNYSTHVLYHLPALLVLDNNDVSSKVVNEIAESVVTKKKIFYQMKSKIIWRQFSDLEGRLRTVKNQVLSHPNNRIRSLMYTLKVLERERSESLAACESAGSESGTESDKDAKEEQAAEKRLKITAIDKKRKAIDERVAQWEKKCEEVEVYYTEAIERLRQITDVQVHRLVVELDSGGNVRFEDGSLSDAWFSSCHDLILSRFCAVDYRDHGIVGIKIHSITRVLNRSLRARFEEELAKQVEDPDNYLPLANKTSNYKRLLEYLFWIWDPDIPGGSYEPAKVLEEGFMSPDMYKQLGKPAAVPLTNSISLADRYRIKHQMKQTTNKEYKDNCVFRHGSIVISKVYVGRSSQVSSQKSVDQSNYPKYDAIYQPRKDMDEKTARIEPRSPGESLMDKTPCECSGRQCEWYVFNHLLAIPEYVVNFEYLTKVKPRSPFLSHEEGLKAMREKRPLSAMDKSSDDEDVLCMSPEVKAKPRLVSITELNLLSLTQASNLSQIRVLNLHGNGLAKVKCLSSLPNLHKLIISFNELCRLDDLSHLPVEYLDASFNKIVTLEGFKSMTKLKYLDLTWNKLQNTREDVSILRKHCPALLTLDLRHNNWQKIEGLRLRAIGRIKTLSLLNGQPVTEQEAAAALRMAAGSRISQVSLLNYSRTDNMKPRTLSLLSSAQALTLYSRNRPDRTGEQDSLWYSKVTTLNLDSQHISKISNLDRLENLRFASFNDNDITKIEGLDYCVKLEELSLDHNCITRIENLSKLTKLKRLTIDHNYVGTLDNCLEKLSSLTYFSIENNRVRSMAGLQRNSSLVELYIGNNHIENVRDIFYVKNLANLIILDMYGNPVSALVDNYRLFVIYHLKSLRALDGITIEQTENAQAREAFGGKLTQDFVAERVSHSNFNEVKELDFAQCSIRTVDLGQGEIFLNLRSINLESNNLTSFSGLVYLVNLRVLCLNHNHIECIVPRTKSQISAHAQKQAPKSIYSMSAQNGPAELMPDSYTPVLENLEVLHLGYNGIKDMSILQLSRLTSLKALFLQGNEISKVEGLEGLQDLRELVLDRNRIKSLSEFSLASQWNLQELHLEENRVKDLSYLACLDSLQRLFLGMNRVQEMGELEKLEPLTKLVELSVVSNTVARRMLHRPLLVYRMPNLHIIDGIPVTEEERTKADFYFMEQQPPQMTTTMEATLPGLQGTYKAQIPVKVTNMQLVSGPYIGSNWSGTLQFNDDSATAIDVQRGGGRRRESKSEPLQAKPVQSGAKLTGTMTYQHGNQAPYGKYSYSSHQGHADYDRSGKGKR